MHAMVLEKPGEKLQYKEVANPEPGEQEVRVKIRACGICRTDLHVLDGELQYPNLPLIPGHQIIGIVEKAGTAVKNLQVGQRVGIPWLGETCGHCAYCRSDRENLCDAARFTGYQINGGFAEYCVANAQFCFPLPENYPDEQVAPLLCAGLIGYRALQKTGNARHLGLYGFGAAAHIIIQLACFEKRQVYAFTRAGDNVAQDFAGQLGAVWAGDSDQTPPHKLDAAIIFAPVGALVPQALQQIRKGGTVVCAGIYMSDIPSFSYDLLWGERSICSVANLTRKDGEEFLSLAPKIPITTHVHTYPLQKANEALEDLRFGRFTGAAVLVI